MSPAVWKVAKISGWLVFLVGTFLILRNSVIDFGPGGEGVFIEQRTSTHGRPLWLLCLRLHVVSGVVCLLSCLPQYSKTLLRRIPPLHRNCGKLYAGSVLFVLCPTGIYLASFAHGGIAGKAGFIVLGVATFYTTLRGVALMMGPRRDRTGHRRWITRSFALVATAISFRIYHTIFFHMGRMRSCPPSRNGSPWGGATAGARSACPSVWKWAVLEFFQGISGYQESI